MKLLHDIRETIRLIRAGELAVLRGSIFGLHVEVTLRRAAPKIQYDPLCACGHHAGDHSWGHFSCSECACDAFGLVTEAPEEPSSGQVQRDDMRCTDRSDVRCPLHGNCCCTYKEGRRCAWSGCPLHADWSDHGTRGTGGAA